MGEVSRRNIVQHAADVASPATTVVGPGDVRIDVGAASLATNDSGSSEIDDFNIIIGDAFVSGHGLADHAEGQSGGIGLGLSVHNLRDRGTEEVRIANNRQVYFI